MHADDGAHCRVETNLAPSLKGAVVRRTPLVVNSKNVSVVQPAVDERAKQPDVLEYWNVGEGDPFVSISALEGIGASGARSGLEGEDLSLWP